MTRATKLEIRSTLVLSALGSIAAYFVYVGIHDGLVPQQHSKWTTFEETPINFILELSSFVLVTIFCTRHVLTLPARLKADRTWIEQRMNEPKFEQSDFSTIENAEISSAAANNKLLDERSD